MNINDNRMRKISYLIVIVLFILLMITVSVIPARAEENAAEISSEVTTELSTEVTTEMTTEVTTEATTEVTTEAPKKKVKLSKPKMKSITAYENGKMYIKWKEVSGADYYLIFRKYKGKSYKQIARTKKLKYTDKKAKAYKECYYKVQAVKKETKTTALSKSKKSRSLHKKSRKKPQRIAYIGDSVMSGFAVYGALDSNEASYAQVSLFVQDIKNTFLGSVNAYKPDRVYIMCGTNNCVGSQTLTYLNGVVGEYKYVIENIHSNNPNCEIVVMGIGNTRTTHVPNTTVNTYNALLKKMSDKYSYVKYFNTGLYLNDSSGSLASGYSAGDGIHWSSTAYFVIHSKLKEFVKKY